MSGKGIYFYSNGARYKGMGKWKKEREGNYIKNGNKYEEGEWLKGKKNGKFIRYTINGDIYKEVNYKNGLEIK